MSIYFWRFLAVILTIFTVAMIYLYLTHKREKR